MYVHTYYIYIYNVYIYIIIIYIYISATAHTDLGLYNVITLNLKP
jgi:hypothetical protein